MISKSESIAHAIKSYLYQFEIEKDINLFYVCEINSRPNGVEVSDSDFDLTGLFLPNPCDSLKVISKIDSFFKITHIKIKICDVEYDVDIDFKDLREFAVQKVRDNIVHFDFGFFSPLVYINKYPDIITTIRDRLKPSAEVFLYKFKNLHEACEKTITRSNECMNKRLLTALLCGVQFFHVYIYNSFPLYNIWEEINFLKYEFGSLINLGKINQVHEKLLLEIFDLIHFYYEEKKYKGRKSTSHFISATQYNFLEWLNGERNNFKIKEIEKNSINFDLDFFQNLCAKILHQWKSIQL